MDYTGKNQQKKAQKRRTAVRIAGSADTVNVGETEKEEKEENDLEAATEETTENVTEKVQASGKEKNITGDNGKTVHDQHYTQRCRWKELYASYYQCAALSEKWACQSTKVEVTYRGDLKGADKAEAVEVLKIQSAQ